MPSERSAGAVVFRMDGDEIRFLLLRKGENYWDLPKGNIDSGEDEITTAKREILEETGLSDVKFLESFKEKISYFYKRDGKTIYKEVIFFLAETHDEEVKISSEHDGFEWLNYQEAVKKAKSKDVINKANEFLTKRPKNLKEFV